MSLHKAILQGHLNHLKYLLKTSDRLSVDYKDSSGYTPLIVSALIDDDVFSLTSAKMLLRHRARVDIVDDHGKTALMHACIGKKTSLIKVLIEKVPAGHPFDINHGDDDGFTALHHAARAGCMEIVEDLVGYCLVHGLTLDTENGKGKTVLDLCLDENFLDAASFLLECGARCGKNLQSLKRRDALTSKLISDELRDKLALPESESPDARTCAEIDQSCFSKANKHLNGNQSLPSLRYTSQPSPQRVTGSRGYHHRLDEIFKAKSAQSSKSYRPPVVDVAASDQNQELTPGSKLHGRKSRSRKISSPNSRRRRSAVGNTPSNSLVDSGSNLFKKFGRRSPSSRRSSDASVARAPTNTRNGMDDGNEYRGVSSPMSNTAGLDGNGTPYRASLDVGIALDENDRESEIEFNEISVRVPSRKPKYSDRKYGGYIETIPEIDSRSGSVINGYTGVNRSNERLGRNSKIQRSNSRSTLNGFNSRFLNPGRNDILTSAGSTRSAMTMMSTGRAMSVQRRSQVKMIFGRSYEGPNRRVDIDNRIKELQDELTWMDKRRKARTMQVTSGNANGKVELLRHQDSCETIETYDTDLDQQLLNLDKCKSTNSESYRRSQHQTKSIASSEINPKKVLGIIPSADIEEKIWQPAKSKVYTQPLPGGYAWIGLQGKIVTVNRRILALRRSKSEPLSQSNIRLDVNQTDDERNCDPKSIMNFIRDQGEINRDETVLQRFHGNPLNNLIREQDVMTKKCPLQAPSLKRRTLPVYGFGLPKISDKK